MLRVTKHGGDTGGLLQGIRQRIAHFARVELEQRRRCCRGAKHLASGAGMAPGRHELARIEREQRARADVVAQHDRAQQQLAAKFVLLRDGERRRHDARSRMRAGRRVRVVRLVSVAARAVGERGVEYRGHMPGADHSGVARAAERLYVGENALARHEPRTRYDGGKGIDDMIFGARGDFCGQLALKRAGYIRA